jgi:type III secretion protein N (ATPase)
MKGSADVDVNPRLFRTIGSVRAARGLTLTAHVPGVRFGDWVQVARQATTPLDAEVVAFDGDLVTLMPLGDLFGVGPGDAVHSMEGPMRLDCGPDLLGRALDGIGRPIDGGPPVRGEPWRILRSAPSALERPALSTVLPTGLRALDGLCTVAEGQRMAIFAPPGVGKTMLLAHLARHLEADVCVVCLVGERGREVNEVVAEALGSERMAKSVLVCATSDSPALIRMKSAHVATAVAEYFRDQGARVILLVDSITRYVRAARDVATSAGEAPGRRGIPASALSGIAPLIERTGRTTAGAITAFYTVLVEGSDPDEPVAEEVRSLVDGHIVLDRGLAERGHYPPIDIPRSLSRCMDSLVSQPQKEAARRVRALLARYEQKRELVELSATRPGGDPLLDAALARLPSLNQFLQQELHTIEPYSRMLQLLLKLAS